MEKFVRIFATTVPAFFPRENPISRKANPACMNMTRHPATITQVELMPTESFNLPSIAAFRSFASASDVAGRSSKSSKPMPSGTHTFLRMRPPRLDTWRKCGRGPRTFHCPGVERSAGRFRPGVDGRPTRARLVCRPPGQTRSPGQPPPAAAGSTAKHGRPGGRHPAAAGSTALQKGGRRMASDASEVLKRVKDEVEHSFADGMGFDGSSITGFNRIEESDMIAMPDPDTFKFLDWGGTE